MQPDLVLADLQMPKLSGLDARRRLINEGICGAIISLTIHSDVKLAKLALSAGIRAYVLKMNDGDDLIPAIRAVLNGDAFLSPAIAGKL